MLALLLLRCTNRVCVRPKFKSHNRVRNLNLMIMFQFPGYLTLTILLDEIRHTCLSIHAYDKKKGRITMIQFLVILSLHNHEHGQDG